MGLTVHFKLSAPPDTDVVRARELVRAMRRRARGFKQRSRVDGVLPLSNDPDSLRRARECKPVPHPWKAGFESGIEIPVEEGFIFQVEVGADCEPLRLGLCRYPKTLLLGGRRYRTDLPGWRFHGFSKTHFASLHGWEHFRRCHTAVIDLLAAMQSSGLRVEGNHGRGRLLARPRSGGAATQP